MAFLPLDDREWLKSRGYDYEELEEQQKRGVVVRAFPLPPGKFQVDLADVYVPIPSGYQPIQRAIQGGFLFGPDLLLRISARRHHHSANPCGG